MMPETQSVGPFKQTTLPARLLAAVSLILLWGCGQGPAIEARPQNIQFGPVPSLRLYGTATVTASATSGLTVRFSSITPEICSVVQDSGLVTSLAAGTCIVAANQPGNDHFAPAPQVTQEISVLFESAQTIVFGPTPLLSLGGTAYVSAQATSGLPVRYSSLTPTVCTVDPSSGLVTDLTAGDCIIAADQEGNAEYDPAPRVTQTITVTPAPEVTVPGSPEWVTATLAGPGGGVTKPNVVTVSIGPTYSGGSPITGYKVTSRPPGISASGTTTHIDVTCPSTCAGYTFTVVASNQIGDGPESAETHVITTYDVVETFLEPDTQPNNTIFAGTFRLDSSTGTVSDLRGILSEAMTGDRIAYPDDNMTWLVLEHQLSSVYEPALGGLLVASFRLPTTNTLSADPRFGGTDGWSPGTGSGLHYGFPGENPGNAYALIFVNLDDPTAPLTSEQINKLAYADCAPGGMMGSTCMTGTTVAGYGVLGSMSGYPISQITTRH